MRYRSNLTAPELSPYFRLREPPLQILGHDIPSDPDYDPNCGFLSHDEAAILYNVARQIGGEWVDLGARFGWSTAHLLVAGCKVQAVDHAYAYANYVWRLQENMMRLGQNDILPPAGQKWYLTTDAAKASGFFSWHADDCCDGFLIDADHDPPQPLFDAQGCARLAKQRAVIVLHDMQGEPVREAARWLIDQGWNCKVYLTPNGLGVLWRGDFTPPDHTPDPAIDWQMSRREMVDFPESVAIKQ